jgi:diacylglycerol kinase (ATP)
VGPAEVVVNTRSRRGRQWFDRSVTLLQDLGVPVGASRPARTIQELLAYVEDAVRRKVPLLVVGGGDGTFSAIAGLMAGSETTLGVLPLGTGNQFARDLHIPADVEAACAILTTGKSICVDVGRIADHRFLNVATLGLSTQIARELTVDMKRRMGRLVYVYAAARAMQNVRPFRVHLETEQGIHDFETLQLVIGNGRFHVGAVPLSPTASIVSGRLSLYSLLSTEKSDLLRLAVNVALGRHVEIPDILTEETEWGRVSTVPSVAATVDGEVCERTPFEFRVDPAALRVMAPLEFEGL